jgi:lysophospholipid acyltransferase (LPLAT)-like uncharacterized protein
MRFLKQLVRSESGSWMICWLIQLYLRFVYATGRWEAVGTEIALSLCACKQPFIAGFWHGRLLMLPLAWRRMAPLHMLISHHADGRLIAGAVRYFGIEWIAGSSNLGGQEALRAMVQCLKAGNCVGITPDGPDGPAMRASPGIVAVAWLSGAPILPVTYATARRRILGSWDRMLLPLPFSRGVFVCGELIEVPKKLDKATMEAWRAHVEEQLNALTAEADRLMGHDKVAPGTYSRSALRAMRRADQHQ